MEGIPFNTDKLRSDGEVIPGNVKTAAERAANRDSMMPVRVTVNGKPVTMPKKEKTIFVDVFDVYPFDLTKAGGTMKSNCIGKSKSWMEGE